MNAADVAAGMADTFDLALWLTGFVALLYAPVWIRERLNDWRWRKVMRNGLRWPL